MPNSIFAKAGYVLALLSLALVSAQARGWDDFVPREPSLKQSDHWEWTWDGTDSLGVGLTGATVHYVPAGSARITITGPEEALEQVRVGQGQIRWCQDCRGRKGLEITVSGVALRNVALGGADIDIQLGHLDQDRLNLSLAGTGEISAGGRIDQLELSIAGSGNVRMSDAKVQRADIHIAGSGNVIVTPREEANVHVAGSGNIRMTRMPTRLNQTVTGSGGVRIIGN